jgi:hypothetical protein
LKLVNINQPKAIDIEQLPLDTIGKIALNYDFIKDFIDKCHEHAVQLTRSGALPSLKLVESSKGRRSWIKDSTKVLEALTAVGLDAETLQIKSLVNLSSAEALLKETNLSKKDIGVLMSAITERGKSTESLVTLEDPRPALLGAKELLKFAPIETFEK